MGIHLQQFLITGKGVEPFLSAWYSYENHYVDGMVIYDLLNGFYAKDGKTWVQIEEDHL